jgi:hypothetical protein
MHSPNLSTPQETLIMHSPNLSIPLEMLILESPKLGVPVDILIVDYDSFRNTDIGFSKPNYSLGDIDIEFSKP